ncbi:MAG: T9SS C-terminal target domain-containing protein, partial [Bacteroidetes bacterium]
AEFIQPTDQMRISFEIADSDFNDVSEAVIDYFRVFDNPTNATQTLDPAAYRLAVAPNPATERFQLHYELDESLRGATLRLLNVLGQTVEEHPLAGAAGSVSLGQSLEPGVYFLQLLHEGRAAASLKLVKQ